jgi:hypothetical protein
MKTVRFYGHSDDCFEIEGGGFDDEVGCYDTPVVIHLKSAAAESRVAVFGCYAPSNSCCCWCFGIGQIDEGDELPPWPIRFVPKHDYSIALEIDVPDDTTLSIETGAGH